METNMQEERTEFRPLGVSGLGGWLVLVQIGLYISIITLLVQLFVYHLPLYTTEAWGLLTSKESEIYHPLTGPLLIFEALFSVALLIFCVCILIMFYRKKSVLPRLMIIMYSVNFIFILLELILLFQIPFLRETEDGSSIRDLIRSILVCAIWIPYFIKSERVHNTFIK